MKKQKIIFFDIDTILRTQRVARIGNVATRSVTDVLSINDKNDLRSI